MEITELTFTVEGMGCASCVGKVEKAAGAIAGVEKAEVNLTTKKMRVQFDSSTTGPEEITTVVKAAGYENTLITQNQRQSFLASDLSCASCQKRLNDAIEGTEGLERFSINIMTKRVTLDFNPDLLDLDSLLGKAKSAGYPLTSVGESSSGASHALPEFEAAHQALKKKVAGAFALTIPLMYLAMGEMVGLPAFPFFNSAASPFGLAVLQGLLALAIMSIGYRFYLVGVPLLLKGGPNMDSLIAVGTLSAFSFSVYHSILIAQGQVHMVHQLYFETSAVIVTLILFGRLLESLSKERSFGAIRELVALQSDQARLLTGEEDSFIAIEEVIQGDVLVVKSGEVIPVDGLILKGQGSSNESMMTGESLPVFKEVGATVIGGCILSEGYLEIQATKVGQNSTLSKMIALVEEAQNSKAPIAKLADLIAGYFVPAVMLIALAAGSFWYAWGMGAVFSIKIFVAVMVIACPCALGLATPTAILVGTSRGAKLGVLIKNGEALERFCKIDAMVFDKTGTLTLGEPSLTEVVSLNNMDETELLKIAASLESGSEHIFANAIIKAAKDKGLDITKPEETEIISGRGLKAQLGSDVWSLGNPSLMDEIGVKINPDAKALDLAKGGNTLVYLAKAGQVEGYLALADEARPEAKKVIAQLKAQGITPYMLTGDRKEVAASIASKIGIEEVISEVKPEEKLQLIKDLQAKGFIVAMVGDGINDAPALTQADIGIAMGAGTEVSMESAQIILPDSSLEAVIRGLKLSRATLQNIKQNLFWAFGYNVLGIPLAAGAFYLYFGWTLNPMFAAMAMALSSVSVVTNSLRLSRFKS
ncbi:MAG: heavy metal translocating P-type ATPase [SAR324 cluster bacterium]|nr:heavy metal translocating P-type ATPase [SAR324 cluster bacterium]